MNSVSTKASQTDESGFILLKTERRGTSSLPFAHKTLPNIQGCRQSARVSVAIEQFALADGGMSENHFTQTINRLRQQCDDDPITHQVPIGLLYIWGTMS